MEDMAGTRLPGNVSWGNPAQESPERRFSRRSLLATSGLGGLGVFAAGFSHAEASSLPTGRYPFTLGVASGDPMPDGVVLWTRLAPEPLNLDGLGGMPDRKIPVQWEVASDERFGDVVRRGHTFAVPELGHSVHVEVDRLRPGRQYFYRFRTGSFQSVVGRTKTAPALGTAVKQLRFGVASCQVWWGGFYTAYRHMAEDDLDVVFHLGDYIYENEIPWNGLHRAVRPTPLPAEQRDQDENPWHGLDQEVELTSGVRGRPWRLEEYRNRYALFKADPDLQAAHAAFPFVLTWDDHEVADNWAGDFQAGGVPTDVFLQRRAAAAQAFYEHLPLRLPQKPRGSSVRLYRRLTYGNLAAFHVLDGRTFRDVQACGGGAAVDCAERLDPRRTMLGVPQEQWLYDGLAGSSTVWNMIVNQVPMSQMDTDPGASTRMFMDAWDGYKAARDRLFDAIIERQVDNPVVVSGDRHRHFACDLKANFDDPDSNTLGVEFGATSISSDQDGEDLDPHSKEVLAANAHVTFMNHQRGYLRMTVTPELSRADHQIVPYVSRPDAPIGTRATFVTEAGDPGVQLDTESLQWSSEAASHAVR